MGKEKEQKEKIIVDTEELEGDKFQGTITNVKSGKTNPNQPEKTYVTLSMDVDYSDEPYDLFIPYSVRKQSVWAFFINVLKDCDVKIKNVEDLKGETFIFERKDIVLRGGFKAKEGFPLPIQHIPKR